MFQNEDKLQGFINRLEEVRQRNALTPKNIEIFLTRVLKVISDAKIDFKSISKENLDTIQKAVDYVEKDHYRLTKEISDKLNTHKSNTSKLLDEKFKEVKDLIEEFKKLKPKDGEPGKDADEEYIIEEVLGKIPKVELDDREKIVKKINTGKKDDVKINLKQVEGSDTLTTKENLDRAIGILDQRSQFLINRTISHTSLSNLSVDSHPQYVLGVNTHKLIVSATEPTSPSVGDLWVQI